MYCHSVNLSIAHYSRRNSIADAHVKPVFVITSAWIESCFQMKLILYYLFTSLLSFISFALYQLNAYLLSSFTSFTETFSFFFYSYLFWIYSYNFYVALSWIQKSTYYKFYLTYFRRNADRHEWNINRTLFKKVRQLISSFLLERYYNNNDAANKYHLINYSLVWKRFIFIRFYIFCFYTLHLFFSFYTRL